MKFLQWIPNCEDWKTTHGTGRKPSLSFFPLWSSICFLTGLTMTQAACDLTPHIWLAKGLSCSSAVNHLGQICTSDWLRAGKVHLSPNTWPHFSTLFCNKVKVSSPWFFTYCHQDITAYRTQLPHNTCISEVFGVGTEGTDQILCHGLPQLLPLEVFSSFTTKGLISNQDGKGTTKCQILLI